MPDLPGIRLEGVVKMDTLEDTRRILHLARRGKPAIVAGGGITALELVEGLVTRGMRVHYLLRGERYWSNVLDPVESHMVQERLKEDGVIVHTNVQVSEIIGRHAVEGVRTQDGELIPARLAAFAVGIRPRLELARSGSLAVKRGILVNDYLQTSDPDIFAAGDAAELTDPVTGEGVLESLWSPARWQGQAAGYNMAGSPIPYQRIPPLNVTRLAGIITTIIGQVGQAKPEVDRDLNGIMRGDCEIWRQGSDAVVAQVYGNGSRMRLYVGEHILYGALIMGDQTLSRPLQHLIENKVDISPIHAELLTPGTQLSQLIKDYEKHSLQSVMKLAP
jgi:NADPH-dependent 2,4-dienoyl-CoA reductase/sulfur reductase-like enzyme